MGINLNQINRSKDRNVNPNDRKLIELCKVSNMCRPIVNERLYEEKNIGEYTFCNSLGPSVFYFCSDKE